MLKLSQRLIGWKDPQYVDVLDEHLQTCLVNAVQADNGVDKAQVLKEITEVYEMASKV